MSERLDPVTLQVMLGGLRAVCDEMGAVLVRAAHSANIKERQDASTALFDAAGQMVMQAEHIPVHLGAMPDAVAAVLGEEHAAGDTWILNDPYHGGTHLPDITLVSPLFRGARQVGFAATRAHHADVGGEVPGSMPAHSRSLEQEGVVIPPTRLTRDWQVDGAHARRRWSHKCGVRPSVQRICAPSSRRTGSRAAAWRSCADRHGDELLDRAMQEVLGYAERRTRASIAAMPDGSYRASDLLEDDGDGVPHDLRIECEVVIAGDELTVDFAGTDPQSEGNLNCPLSVTKSAVYYVVRVLTDPDIPPSAGAYRPVHVSAPPGSLVNARPPAAVAGGNVETSSRIADVTMAALAHAVAAPASGQGTMNNLTLGNDRVHVLRDDRGRTGSLPGRRWAVGRPRCDEQHAQHADRGARGRVPLAGPRVRGQARVRRGRAPLRR